MNNNKVAVLGGGDGGHTVAADLTLKGFQVSLCDLPQFSDYGWLKNTMETGEIELTGAIQGVAKINLVTTDIKEALKDANIIFVVARSNADALFAEACAPYVEDGQIILLAAGNCGSLVFINTFKDKKVKKDVLLAESASLPYGCRIREPTHRGGPTHARAFFITSIFAVGVFPANRTDEVISRLKKFYSGTIAMTNVLEAGMSNPNTAAHCAPTILNVGRIERVAAEKLGDFALFHEGCSESVMRVVTAIMIERGNIFKALGWKVAYPVSDTENIIDNILRVCKPRTGVEEALKQKGPMGPINEARYITEDVPYGLVTYSSFGKMVGVETPAINSMIQLSSVMNQVDYMAEGRTVEKLGISDMTIKELNDFLYKGTKML